MADAGSTRMWQYPPAMTVRRVALLVLLASSVGCGGEVVVDPEAPPPDVYANDIHTSAEIPGNPDFVPDPPPAPPTVGIKRQALTAEGEVIVIEGGGDFVSSMGGAFGITDRNQRAIVQEVFTQYPDRFDTIAIFLSFIDQNHAGTAYYQGIANQVQGIGRQAFNSRSSWRLPDEGRLSGFVNMNSVEMFGGLRGAGSAFSSYHAVLAQELSHRWLMHLRFLDAAGMDSDAFLGRQDAHWSPLVDADGSVQDGIDWRDNGDGTFTNFGSENGFAGADLWAMGIWGPEQVEDWFYIVEATLGPDMLDKTSRIPSGATINGRRVDVTIEQVIGAMGPRNPPKGTETPYYRSAFVLVTEPGQPRAAWQPYLDAVQGAQASFPETWKTWSLEAGAMCTKVTEPCAEPELELDGHSISDGGDDLVGPGESFDLSLSLRNNGTGTAENVQVSLFARSAGVTVETGTVTADGVPENGVGAVPTPFRVTLGANLKCGDTISFAVKMKTDQGPTFRSSLDLVIGNQTVRFDPLHEAPDWHVDPDSTDTAGAGTWDLGTPDFISILGVVTQPPEDHTPGEGKLSFHTGVRRGASFSDNDVDGGVTTLESPVFAIGDTRDPSLVFYAWHLAVDFANAAGPAPVSGADLVVSASNDGGETWVEIGRIEDNTEHWRRVAIRLRPFLVPTNRVRFRFQVADPSVAGTVEAGVDDIEVIDILAECPVPPEATDPGGVMMKEPEMPEPMDDEGGCGCSAAPTTGGTGAAITALLVLAAVLRRRRS